MGVVERGNHALVIRDVARLERLVEEVARAPAHPGICFRAFQPEARVEFADVVRASAPARLIDPMAYSICAGTRTRETPPASA